MPARFITKSGLPIREEIIRQTSEGDGKTHKALVEDIGCSWSYVGAILRNLVETKLANYSGHEKGLFKYVGAPPAPTTERVKSSDEAGAVGSPMMTMNVSLPRPMRDWVEAQAKTGRYSSASDYVRDVIRHDQERASKMAELQMLITQGIESGVSPHTVDDLLRIARI
jgi:antitoxin ParD1/3/4